MNVLAAKRAQLSGNSVVFEGKKIIGSEMENKFHYISHDPACLPS